MLHRACTIFIVSLRLANLSVQPSFKLFSPGGCEIDSGCVCKPGYVKEGNTCIPQQNCGCVVRGKYISKGNLIKFLKLMNFI